MKKLVLTCLAVGSIAGAATFVQNSGTLTPGTGSEEFSFLKFTNVPGYNAAWVLTGVTWEFSGIRNESSFVIDNDSLTTNDTKSGQAAVSYENFITVDSWATYGLPGDEIPQVTLDANSATVNVPSDPLNEGGETNGDTIPDADGGPDIVGPTVILASASTAGTPISIAGSFFSAYEAAPLTNITGAFGEDGNVNLSAFGTPIESSVVSPTGSGVATLTYTYTPEIPEPTTFALLGLAGLFALRRRR
jgi:hypothetical protein